MSPDRRDPHANHSDTEAPEPLPVRDDAVLAGWLDAARRGGFPTPARADRWQVLRAGVVNLWEFERAEYWHARGWAQLTGRNETGKSTLMALTTLIPWLADTGPGNIDTLGRGGKRFRYYVEPTGADGDRRDADKAANRGWLWVEYGRLVDNEPRYFTTLLYAEARGASASVDLKWCTLEGAARIRADVDLAPRRAVATWKEIDAPGYLAHATATDYKASVARRLLGATIDRLDAVGKMLKVTRTPKLGAQLQIGFVQDHLRDALPELSRAEVDALATGWDQLDQIRADLATTSSAAATIGQFLQTAWVPWVQAALRQRADAAAAARTEFDRVTRKETEAREALATSQAEETRLADEVMAQRVAADAARAAADHLQGSVQYRDIRERLSLLDHHRQSRDDLKRQLAERRDDLARAQRRAETAAGESELAGARVDAAAAASGEALDGYAVSAAKIHVPVHATGFDDAAAGQTLRDLGGAVSKAELLLEDVVSAGHAADLAETTAAAEQNRADQDRQHADLAWEQAEAAHGAVCQALAAWGDGLHPPVAPALIDAWIDGMPKAPDAEGLIPGDRLTDSVRVSWFEPARGQLDQARAQAERARADAVAEVRRRTADIEQLRTTPVPRFAEPAGWTRRDRPPASPAGAPLWALLDPKPGTPADALAGIEAALAAIGLLDAWVTPDGVFALDRDGDDVVTTVGTPVAGPNLATVLDIAENAGELAGTVTGVLAGVALAGWSDGLAGWNGGLAEWSDGPAGDGLATGRPTADGGAGHPGDDWPSDDGVVAVAPNGRWRAAGLAGRAKPAHERAEWIGDAARAAQRRRRILELDAERAEWQTRADEAAEAKTTAEDGLAALTAAFARCPNDEPLRSALSLAHDRDGVAQRSQAVADRAQASAATLRATADATSARFLTFCAERRLPADVTGLRQFRADLAEATERLTRYRQAAAAVADARSAADQAHRRQAEAAAEAATHQARRDDTAARLARMEATVTAIESTIDADDKAVLDKLERLREEEQTAIQARDRLSDQLRAIGEQVGQARATLESTQENRREATVRRDDAFKRFRHLIDKGLDLEIGLDLPSRESGVIERVREQVAETRRHVTPRAWPEVPDDQEAVVQRRAGDLSDKAQDVRVSLEAGGRTLRIVRDDAGLPRVEIVVDSSGAALGPREAGLRLGQIHAELEATYNQRVQETLDELLGSTFLEHLRDRLGDAYALVDRINAVLIEHPVVTTQTSLRIRLDPLRTSDEAMIKAIRGASLADPRVAAEVRAHLRQRVEEAKRTAEAEGEADWRERLAVQLDYRQWLDVHLERKIGREGRWAPLTTQTFAEMSGGARAVMLMLPLVSTLAALYEEMDGAPRPLWLDEAFDGLDAANRAMVMGLFQRFDLDVLLAGPARLVNVATVPAAAIYQVVRAPAPLPGADLTLELWAGGDLIQVDLPVTLPVGSPDDVTALSRDAVLL